MAKFDRITCIPTILNGQPTIRGMRLSVRRVIEALAVYPNWDDLRREYPELEPEDTRQALEFAARNWMKACSPWKPCEAPVARSGPAAVDSGSADVNYRAKIGADCLFRQLTQGIVALSGPWFGLYIATEPDRSSAMTDAEGKWLPA